MFFSAASVGDTLSGVGRRLSMMETVEEEQLAPDPAPSGGPKKGVGKMLKGLFPKDEVSLRSDDRLTYPVTVRPLQFPEYPASTPM